jgi:hypothetical protein
MACRLLFLQVILDTRGWKIMTIRLIKRKQKDVSDEKVPHEPSMNELLSKTQNWVKEFKQRKARSAASLTAAIKNA